MSSSVPIVIPAFKALAIASLPLGSQFWWGAVLPTYEVGPGAVEGLSTGIIVQVKGIRFDEDEPGELGPLLRHEEHYNILGCVISWSGGLLQDEGDGLTAFDRCLKEAYVAYNALSVAVANNIQLGLTTPAPRIVWMRQMEVTPSPDARGYAQCEIDFEAQVQARVTSQT